MTAAIEREEGGAWMSRARSSRGAAPPPAPPRRRSARSAPCRPARGSAACCRRHMHRRSLRQSGTRSCKRSGAAMSAPETEGWVKVEKAPMVVLKEEEPECSPEPNEDGVPVSTARAGSPGAPPSLRGTKVRSRPDSV
jgi:hypothetical protein